MTRNSSIAVALACLALFAAPAASEERPLYMESVLYQGDAPDAPLFFAAADSGDLVPPDARMSAADDSVAAPASPALTASARMDSVRAAANASPSIAVPLAVSAVFGTALGYAMGWAGVLIDGEESSGEVVDAGELALGATGLVVGEIVGVALGAHLGNKLKGSFGRDLAISFLTGLMAFGAAAYAGVPGAILGGAAQVYITVRSERDGAADKAEERAALGLR